MESDNNLCISLDTIKHLALTENRYFISTGVGTSGWIMSRQFLQDFYQIYTTVNENNIHKLLKGKKYNITGVDIKKSATITYYKNQI